MAKKKGRPSTRKPSSGTKGKKPDEAPEKTDSKADPEKNWANKPDSDAYEKAGKLYKLIKKAFDNKQEQLDAIEEYWNIYNCTPDDNQAYSGNTQSYIPATRDALNARTKRALKQLFPVNYKHVDGVSTDGRPPWTQLALLEHYIRITKLSSIVRSDLLAGDVTGQWNLMIDWTTSKRSVTKLVKRNPVLTDIEGGDLEAVDPMSEDEETEEEEVTVEGPDIVDFATDDIVVIPPTCTDLQKADVVAIRLRLSEERVEELVEEGVFILPKGAKNVADYFKGRPGDKNLDRKNAQKRASKDAGVKTDGTDKHLLCFMCYSRLPLEGDKKQSAITYFAGQEEILGIIKNPLWSGRIPILSAPVDRIQGSFFGKSKIEPVKFTQWNLTDFWNMGQDSAMYSMLPVIAADPQKAPNWQTLTIGLAAIWPISPDSVKPISFPQLWKESAQICDTMKKQIWESLEVNEAMMGRMPGGRKNGQQMGNLQQEQQINITDHATRYETEMLNPLLEFMFEFDQQFRTDEVLIEARGEIGVKAALETIPVQSWDERYFFRWTGTEFMMGIQRIQQQIATMNVLKGIPPNLLNGRKLDVTPIMTTIVENVFGVEVAPSILVDTRNLYTVAPEMEDEMMANGLDVQTHEADDDPEHIKSHMRAAAINTDPQGLYKKHMMMHYQQLQAKRQMEQQQKNPTQGGVPGGPGGAGPGVGGTPRPGAMPGQPRPVQQPPGAIHADQMADGAAVPRG